MPARRYRREHVIQLVEGVSGSGKRRLSGDAERQASSREVKDLRREAGGLKSLMADLILENRLLKKSMIGDGDDQE